MVKNSDSTMRWSDYFLKQGADFHTFLRNYLQAQSRDVLLVLGLGFDPRMCIGYEALLKAGGTGKRDCKIVKFVEGVDSVNEKYKLLVEANLAKLNKLIPQGSQKEVKEVHVWSEDHRRITSRSAAAFFNNIDDFRSYTDVIIDVSAMPRAVYFSLIGKALTILDANENEHPDQKSPNLFVLVSENASLDSKIKDAGNDEDANYLHGFTGNLETETYAGLPKIWIPMLGENQGKQLATIANKVIPEEVCPMLPMPAANPRRPDNLLAEYNDLLFLKLIVEPRNFIYVAERNPFEVYREIHNVVQKYETALEDLGGCQVVISASSSKLLSIGALLAGYELRDGNVGVINVETQGYDIEDDINKEIDNTILSILWLSGDCYRK